MPKWFLGRIRFPENPWEEEIFHFHSTKMDENGSCSMVSWQSEGGPSNGIPRNKALVGPYFLQFGEVFALDCHE